MGQGFVTHTGQQVSPGEFDMAASVAQPAALCFMSCLTGGRLGDDDEFTMSHPQLQQSLEPQMLTEGVMGAAVWMNNFPALQLRAMKPRGGERDNKTVKQNKPPAQAAQQVLDRAMLFFTFSLLQSGSIQPPPSSISPHAEVKTLEMSRTMSIWTPPSHPLPRFPWLPEQGQAGLALPSDWRAEVPNPWISWGPTAMGACW